MVASAVVSLPNAHRVVCEVDIAVITFGALARVHEFAEGDVQKNFGILHSTSAFSGDGATGSELLRWLLVVGIFCSSPKIEVASGGR